MNKLILLLMLISVSVLTGFAQTKETFDILTFKTPKGWQKEVQANAVQLGVENANGICLITILKSVAATDDSRANFDTAWKSVVKETVTVKSAPQMSDAGNENGWIIESGLAEYESDGKKGVVMLLTATGNGKMLTTLILTNSQAFMPEIQSFIESISLPRITPQNSTSVTPNTNISTSSHKSNFTFSTTNFDDGWVANEQDDWVEVTKGTTRVLIHYPNKNADKYNSVLLDGLKNGWNVLVAPRYSSASNFEFKPVTGWQSIEFAEADMVEKTTGKRVHVVLFKMNYSNGSGKYMEFITPNKAAFEQEFGVYHQTSYGWEKMEKMATYNKFAVSAADLNGKWSNNFSSAIQYVNANTGADAGMDTHASVQNFVFGGGKNYSWDIGVASGQVGNIKFQSAKSSGNFSVPNNWQVTFSNIEGKPKTYNVSFSCVKGARILWLDDTAFGKIE